MAERFSEFFVKNDIHVHAPAGSIPKDGPSAGITITAAILSILTGKKIRRDIAMTGEITLRGDVLPIGGLKEKALAARAAGIRQVILPRLNERDLAELPATLLRDLTFYPVDHMDRVLELTLEALKGPGSCRTRFERSLRNRRPVAALVAAVGWLRKKKPTNWGAARPGTGLSASCWATTRQKSRCREDLAITMDTQIEGGAFFPRLHRPRRSPKRPSP